MPLRPPVFKGWILVLSEYSFWDYDALYPECGKIDVLKTVLVGGERLSSSGKSLNNRSFARMEISFLTT